MSITVYANSPYIYAYQWHDTSKKQGKIPGGTPLTVINEVEGFYEILPPPDYEPVIEAGERWFVKLGDTYKGAQLPPGDTPEAPGAPITAQDALAFVKVLRYVLGH